MEVSATNTDDLEVAIALPENLAATKYCGDSVYADGIVSRPSDEELSETMYTCSICLGVPRSPVIIRRCFHLGCETCFEEHYTRNLRVVSDISGQGVYATCPLCRGRYDKFDIVHFRDWSPLAKWAYSAVRVKCSLAERKPNGSMQCEHVCPIVELERHERFECSLRRVTCPNYGCEFENAEWEVRMHFSACPYVARFCTTCKLPVLLTESRRHNCVSAMQETLQKMIEKCQEYGVPIKSTDIFGEPGKLYIRKSDTPKADNTTNTTNLASVTPNNSPIVGSTLAPRRVNRAPARLRLRGRAASGLFHSNADETMLDPSD